MSAAASVIEFAGFNEGDAFSIHDFLSREPELCAGCDLRVLFDARMSREHAAEMLEEAARRLRAAPTDVSLDDARWLLMQIGRVHG